MENPPQVSVAAVNDVPPASTHGPSPSNGQPTPRCSPTIRTNAPQLSDEAQEQSEDIVGHTEEDEFELLMAALVPLPAVIEQEPDAPPPKYQRFSSRHFVRPRPDDEWETESEAEFTDSSELVNSSSEDEDDEPPMKQGRVDPEGQKSAAQRAKEREEEEKKRIKEDAVYLRFRIATLGEEIVNAGLDQGESSSDSENDAAGGTR